jgi:antitoxin component of MazEF toxin-antitoxin module
MAIQKIIKAGNSLAVTIPSDLVKLHGLKAGDDIKVIRSSLKPQIIFRFTGSHQLSLTSGIISKKLKQ